jgi:hexosaminidase
MDKARYQWRGLLIDSSRHFLEIEAIQRQIDALSASKMNTLHWHLTDAQSFPIYSNKYPNLALEGAYAPAAIYSTQQVQNLIDYAKQRGVRVVPEFDIPGHAASWGKGDPSLTVNCPLYAHNINNIPLDPTQPHTYEVLEGFLTEMSTLFPDNTLHLGGDEIVFGCWLTNNAIADWMKQHGIKTGPALAQYFEENLFQDLQNINKTIVVWQDLFDNGVLLDKSRTIIEVWKTRSTIKSVAKAGFRTFLSAGWYLNEQIPNPQQTFYEFIDTWIDFYINDPIANLSLTPAEAALVIGGEACMWGEQADGDSMDTLIWPRTVAVAERLWSPVSVTDINDAKTRFAEHSCRLRQRGVRSAPILAGYCPLPKKTF